MKEVLDSKIIKYYHVKYLCTVQVVFVLSNLMSV